MAPNEFNTIGYAARDSTGILSPFQFNRREVGDNDVEFDIKFCGMCHSDLHQVKNEWFGSKYPMVPGHELAGVVTKVGSKVSAFKIGDHVGVGCMSDSCRSCDACDKHLEQYCPGTVWTYNTTLPDGSITYGGYSNRMVTDEKFVLRIPSNLPLDASAPLLCAGITVYSPMAHFGFTEPGKSLAVVGLGGLGHMAVKIGKAFGLKVTVLSTSPNKKEEAITGLGADHFLVTKNKEEFKAAVGTFDYMLDTVSAPHDIAEYLSLLKVDGKLVMVGAPPEPFQLRSSQLFGGRKTLAGSLIGGIKETQEMLDFCGKHNITATIETIPISYVNTAMERMLKADVKYRFVIDLSTLKE